MSASISKYRPDIDGLRAIAIVPVVAFHAFPQWVPGGFVGVDVFFVISGFLISTIILEALDDRTFTLTGFYARRIRRIFPALLVVLVACLMWGWWGLFAADYAQLGKHAAAGAGFAANLVLWNEAGYFDTVSEAKPLLHLWSLGIEEQFYLLWPTLLYVAWRGTRRLVAVIATVLIASFAYNAILTRTDEVAAFYSPVTRLWELLLGAAFAYLALARSRTTFASGWTDRFWRFYRPPLRDIGGVLGFAAVVASVFLFNRDTSFPGWRAALPAGGTLLCIGAGADAWLNRQLLSARWLVALGLISYPLYLWHWPLLSLAVLKAEASTSLVRIVLIAASLLLAWATYRVVERPIRFQWRGRAPIIGLCVLMLATGLAGYAAFARDGFIERPINRSDQAHFLQYYERMRTRGLAEAYRAECDFMDWASEKTQPSIAPSCTAPGTHGTVFLWGDSHAQALSLGLRSILPADLALAQVTTSGCPPRLREREPQAFGGRCERANGFARERIAALKPDLVVLAQIMAHESTDWAELAQALRTLGAKRVTLIGPMPQWQPSLPVVVVNHYWGRDYTFVDRGLSQELFETDRMLTATYANGKALEYVSLIAALCGNRGCRATAPDEDNPLIAVDNGHLSPAGSTFVANTILRAHVPRG
jgi:peptidoglycan/LPS O-acetylase OafA/YrhL